MVDRDFKRGDWLACPECGSGDVWFETILNAEGKLIPLRFHCMDCNRRSPPYDPPPSEAAAQAGRTEP